MSATRRQLVAGMYRAYAGILPSPQSLRIRFPAFLSLLLHNNPRRFHLVFILQRPLHKDIAVFRAELLQGAHGLAEGFAVQGGVIDDLAGRDFQHYLFFADAVHHRPQAVRLQHQGDFDRFGRGLSRALRHGRGVVLGFRFSF